MEKAGKEFEMKSFCLVFAFVIITTLMHGQQTTGASSDEHYCDDAMFRTLCLHIAAQGRETETILKDTEKLRSGEPTKQIDGIVSAGAKINSRVNDHAISETVADESIKTIGGVAQQGSKGLSDVESSIQTVFTPSEQGEITRQMNHYTQAIVNREAPQTAGQVSGNRVSGQQAVRVSSSEQVRQAQPPSSWHSDVFTSEERISIDKSLSIGIVKKHEQEKAAARAWALAEKQRIINEKKARDKQIEIDQANAIARAKAAAWAAQHPQQVIIRSPVVDCSGEWDSPPPGCSQRPSSYTSCGDSACTAK
jgi:hypothetical protein